MELNRAETIKQDSNKENQYFLVKAIILTVRHSNGQLTFSEIGPN